MKKVDFRKISPYVIFIVATLFIHTVILDKSIKELDWIFYFILFAVSILTGYIFNKRD